MKNKKDAQEAMLHIMYGMSLILDMAVSELCLRFCECEALQQPR